MITPYLEQLIHEGRATFRTYPCGIAALYRMQIPENQYIVITDIYFNDFVDSPADAGADNANQRINQRIQINSSLGGRTNILHRSQQVIQKVGLAEISTTGGLMKHYEIYSIHAGLLKIGISVLPSAGAIDILDYVVPPFTAEEDVRNVTGYGNPTSGAGTSANIRLNNGAFTLQYNPLTEDIRPLFPLTAAIEQLTPPVLELNAASVTGVNGAFNSSALPLFTVCFVQVFEPIPEKFRF
jgi:hypothetical protein